MAVWAIGDVHGCLDKLIRLWAALEPGQDDEVVLLGDLIDRGPDSRGVLDWLLQQRRSGLRVHAVRGNHEQLCLRACRSNDPYLTRAWLCNGGDRTLHSYGIRAGTGSGWSLPAEHLAFLEELPLWFEIGPALFVHAGLRPGRPVRLQDAEDLLWIRDEFYGHPEAFSRPVVFGHTPFPRVFRSGTLVGIDTGAVYGRRSFALGRLTAYEPFQDRVVQVD